MGSLIAVNPAVEGMDQMAAVQQRRSANELARLRYEEARRTADAESQVDNALREWILKDGGLGNTGADPGAQPPAAPGGAALPAAGAQPMAPNQPGSIGRVPVPAPGPQATAQRGDAAGFQQVLQSALGEGQATQPGTMGNATPQMGAAGATPIPNATPAMQGRLVPVQQERLPGQLDGPGAARTHAIDRRALAQRLAQVPGAGQAAFNLLTEQEGIDVEGDKAARETHDHAVTNFFASIDKGDIYSARYWASQAGMDIDEETYGDAEQMRMLSIAGKYKAFYGTDLEDFGAFLSDALTRAHHGDPDAFQNAFQLHKPKRMTGQGRVLSPENATFQDLVRKHGGDTVAAYQELGELKKKTGAGGRGPTTFEQRQSFAERLYPDDPVKQANFINGGRAPTGLEIRKMAVDELKAQYGNTPPRDEWDALLTKKMGEIRLELGSLPIGDEDQGDINMRIPSAEENTYTADMPGIGPIYSNDGITWYDDQGNQISQ